MNEDQQVLELVELLYRVAGMSPGEQAQFIFDAGYRKAKMRRSRNGKIQIGYLCSSGHFQMNEDPAGDNCQADNIAPIYIEVENPEDEAYIRGSLECALNSYNRKLEEWRRG